MLTPAIPLRESLQKSLRQALKTAIWILKIILPVSLVVALLQYYGVIAWVSHYLSPLFHLIGLPGEASIVYLSSLFLPLYAPIAIISTMALTVRESTILALMCLIAHSLPIETAIQKKSGTPVWSILIIRIGCSILGGCLLNMLLPVTMTGHIAHLAATTAPTHLGEVLLQWAESSFFLSLKIIAIITGLMLLQGLLKSYGLLDLLARIFSPVMRFFGLPKDQAFLWLTAQTVGLAYGSAILLAETQERKIPAGEINLLNYHIAVNHSLLEDTLIFASMGIPPLWIIWPRLLFAFLLVWGVHLYRYAVKHRPIKLKTA